MSDNLNVAWDKFFNHRAKPLWDRFSGYYRAQVVETNDPLRAHRVRFKCPDLHDWSLADEDCPWAVPAADFGVKRQGHWTHPCRLDWVWITFERNHPNAPIWVGIATPTRRKFYAYPSIYGATPVPVNEDGNVESPPQDYNQDYMPQDERPMSTGIQDRYGNLDLISSVGFYPAEHAKAPAPADFDAVQQGQFDASQTSPQTNYPDVKHMTRLTKYGNMLIMGDQGYAWSKQNGNGEFYGDFDKDEQFEIKRWLYLQKLINENQPNTYDGAQYEDQRRIELKTRYGHKFEARDVGWAQQGPIASQTRPDEYDSPTTISLENINDFRWMKMRTKAGMLFQMYDKGADPSADKFIKRKLLDEVAHLTEQEDQYWAKKDARWIRIITRYGFKIVLDDRGSDDKDAEGLENPRGNGILIKGRRTGKAANQKADGDPRGFYWEFNEQDALNHLTMGTPLGAVLEQNDRYEYQLLATSVGNTYSTSWQKVKENEFLLTPTMKLFPETASHHLKIDHENEYIRFKTRANHGQKPNNIVNPPEVGSLNQGWEARDGSQGDGAWVEMVDCDERGLWFSHKYQVSVWRAKPDMLMDCWMDEPNQTIVVVNNKSASSRIKLICTGDIELLADGDINITAQKNINLNALGGNINLTAGGTQVTVDKVGMLRSNVIYTNWAYDAIHANNATEACVAAGLGDASCPVMPPVLGDAAKKATIPPVPQLAPTDRGQTYNGPFESAPRATVEHPIGGSS